MDRASPARRRIRAVLPVVILGVFGFLGIPASRAQGNFITMNNGSKFMFAELGATSSGSNPNLYYRCYPHCILWDPIGSGGPGLDVTGWQWATTVSTTAMPGGSPLFFFVRDDSFSCVLSAAIGAGFPPNHAKILSSSETLLALSFYTPVPCSDPYAIWFTFQGSTAAFQAPSPQVQGQPNLLAGWSDPLHTTQFRYQYVIGSLDEQGLGTRSYENRNAFGLGLWKPSENVEWDMEIRIDEPAMNPELPNDPGGRSGYFPTVGPGQRLQFRTQDTSNAGSGYATINVFNASFRRCEPGHVPGFTLMGQHLPVTPDATWLLVFPLLIGTPYSPLAGGSHAAVWNPHLGWTGGGESISPSIPISNPGLIGQNLSVGSYSFNVLGSPVVNAASSGSFVMFR